MNPLTNYLHTYFDEVTPYEFYRELFPEGELQEQGVTVPKNPNLVPKNP